MEDVVIFFNLSDSEYDVYVALLGTEELGPCDIARKIGMSRSAIYGIAQRLIEKNIVKRRFHNHKTVFTVESLDNVQRAFKEKQEELTQAKT